ncbi:MAG: cytidylate kinase-like family protein [Pygmaiobacter sp.]
MKPFVITIARENGSGGRLLGERLAQELGIEFYNRDLMRLASDESGINEELFARVDEQMKNTLLSKVARDAYKGEVIPPDSEDFTSSENLFRYQARVILELARSRSCVIIGRCADYILQDCDNVLRVFLHAPEPARVATLMERHHISEEEARRAMTKVDKRRAAYYRAVTDSNWRDAEHYDLSLDMAKLGEERCIALIRGYLAMKLAE